MANTLLDRLMKNSTIKDANVLEKSKFFIDKDMIPTSVPAINVALSGSFSGGLTPGLTVFSGVSKMFKSGFSLFLAKSYMDHYPDAVLVLYDTEFGMSTQYFDTFGIDKSRVLHVPITDIEQLKFECVKQITDLGRGDRVIFVIDSIGNIASKKEIEDTLNEKSVADMSRAKQLKSFFRMVTPYLNLKDIPMIAIAHVYQSMELYSKPIVSGGCLVADTKITMSDGTLKNVQDINVGESVKTIFGNKNVTSIWNPLTLLEGTPECYDVEFEDGFNVICSDKHKFLIDNNWVEAKNLSVGQKVETINQSSKSIIKVTSVGKQPVYDISVADVEHYVLENGVITHNTGVYYAADNIYVVGRRQEKDGNDISGYEFVINVEKSRYVKEKSKIPISISFEKGISKWSGLLEMALESGHVIKPSNGWYQRINKETSEIEEKKYRMKDTDNAAFWQEILNSKSFQEWVESNYRVGYGSILGDEKLNSEIELIDTTFDEE